MGPGARAGGAEQPAAVWTEGWGLGGAVKVHKNDVANKATRRGGSDTSQHCCVDAVCHIPAANRWWQRVR